MAAAHYDPASETLVYVSSPETSVDTNNVTERKGGRTRADRSPDLRIVHFNDVYHVEAGSAEPVGGIARFQTLVNYYRNLPESRPGNNTVGVSSDFSKTFKGVELITLFSGDVFNPSLESSVTKGQHMIPVLDGLRVTASCVGNHDLDFGISQFRHLRSQCNFPWLLANVLDPALGEDVALAGCQKTAIIEASNGIKIGLIGIAEREWLDTINSLPPNLIYQSASETAKRLVPGLRAQGAEIVIALTHQREPNDIKLAEKTPPGLLDMILGGHDHYYGHKIVNGTHVLRSGTDFKQLSYIEAWRCKSVEGSTQTSWNFDITRRDVTRAIPEDPFTTKLVNQLTSSLMSKLEKPIGYTAVPLDGRFTTIRTRESNLGNWVCDLMRHFYSTDCALMASGTIRGDQIYPPGVIRLKDIMNCFPFEDPVVVLRVSGKDIWAALENSVCLVPALEGRFPQVSNITFAFDPAKPSGSRVRWAKIHQKDIDFKKMYTMATRGYMARGKDGFASLLAQSEPGGTAEEVVSEENGILISMVLRQYFMSLKVLGKWARWSPSLHRHWSEVHGALHAGDKIKSPVGGRKCVPPPLLRPAGEVKYEGANTTRPKRNSTSKTNVDGDVVDSDTSDEEVGMKSTESRGENDLSQRNTKVNGAKSANQAQDALLSAQIEGENGKGYGSTAESSSGSQKRERDRRQHLARVYTRIWMKLAGIERDRAGVVEPRFQERGEDEEEEEDDDQQGRSDGWRLPHWTHGIAPKVEGRIVIIGSQEPRQNTAGDTQRKRR